MKTKISVCMVAFALLFGCNKEEEVYPSKEANEGDELIESEFIDVVIDPETGEPVATNFDQYPATDWNEQKQSGPKNASIGGQIFHEFTQNLGTAPHNALEVYHNLPPGYALTGIGLRISNNNVTTMVIEQRFIKSDGSLGPRYRTYHGTAPNHALEVWYAVPDRFLITGLGVRVGNGNVTTLLVHYKRISEHSTANNVFLEDWGLATRVGTAPNHALEIDFEVSDFNTFLNRTVLTGIGFRCNNDNITTMKVQMGYLRNQ